MSDTYKTTGASRVEIEAIAPEGLLPRADALRVAGWRLIQVLAISMPEGVELSYSFGLELEMRVLRFMARPGSAVPSLTPVYAAAFLYENEIRDLFNVAIERISVDWLGKTYDVAEAGRFDTMRLSMTSSEEGAR